MSITCPKCETSYKVNEEAIGEKGRSVKCVRCANIWHARLDAEPIFETTQIVQKQAENRPSQRADIKRPSAVSATEDTAPMPQSAVSPPVPSPLKTVETPSIEPELPAHSAGEIDQTNDADYVPRTQMQSYAEQSVLDIIEKAKESESKSEKAEAAPNKDGLDKILPAPSPIPAPTPITEPQTAELASAEEEQAGIAAEGADVALPENVVQAALTDDASAKSLNQEFSEFEGAESSSNEDNISEEGAEILAGVSQAMIEVDQNKKVVPVLGARAPKVKFIESQEQRRHLQQNFLGICAFLIACCVLVGLGVFREAIVKVMPETASIYSAAGMSVNLRGLDFSDVRTQNDFENGVPILIVTGTIENVAENKVDLPNVRLALRSSRGREVYAWSYSPTVRTLEAGERISFSTRVASPPEGASDIQLRFVGSE